jgi:hypothetical protein
MKAPHMKYSSSEAILIGRSISSIDWEAKGQAVGTETARQHKQRG